MIRDKIKFELIEKQLQENNLRVLKPIGHGSFGQVLLVEDQSKQLFAAKIISKAFLRKKSYLQKYIAQECQIMGQLDHPNIVKNYQCLKSHHFLILINEYCNGGNLLRFQARLPNRKIPLDFSLQIISDVLKGLKAMHDRKFIHRDIKSQNILVYRNPDDVNRPIFKITDFGFARSISQSSAKTLCGTEKFMAPEILNHEPYGEGVDIWSVGVVFHFILFADFPFKGFQIKRQIQKKCRNGFQLSVNFQKQYSNQHINDFFRRVFCLSKQDRITIPEIVNHQLFADHKDKLLKQMNLQTEQQKHQMQLIFQDEQTQNKEEEEDLLNDPHSEVAAQDLNCGIIQEKERVDASVRHLEREIEEIKLEIDKIEYLKESAQAIFETYRQYFFYSQRIAASYYILKAALILGKPLLSSLDKLEMPQGMKQLKIEFKKWISCTLSQEYIKQLDRLKQIMIELENKYEDTYFYASRIVQQISIKNFAYCFSYELQDKFQDIKISYRSTTSHLFSKLNSTQEIDEKLKVKMQMRLFCCHMINRIFNRNSAMNNFEYFRKWLTQKKITFTHSFDMVYFKKWVANESEENLKEELRVLIDKYF